MPKSVAQANNAAAGNAIMPDNKQSSVSRIRHIVSSDFVREVISLFLPTTEKLTVLQLLFIAYYINAIGQRIYQKKNLSKFTE